MTSKYQKSQYFWRVKSLYPFWITENLIRWLYLCIYKIQKFVIYIYIFLFIRYSNAAIKKPIDVIYTQRLGFIYNAKGTYVFEAFEKQLMNAKLTKKLVALKLLSFPWIAIGYIDDISSKIV